MDVPAPTLLFVFDAEGGLIDRLVFVMRRKFGSEPSECPLSALTRKGMGELPRWRAFTRSLDLPVRYLHREEFRGHHQSMSDIELPAVFFCYDDGSLELALSAEQIRACRALDDLERVVRQCVADFHRAQKA